MLLFFTTFFNLRERNSKLHKALIVLGSARLLYVIIQMASPYYPLHQYIDLLCLQVVFFIAVLLHRKGIQNSKWFLVAYSLFNFFCIIAFLEHLVIIPSNIITVYAMYTGVVLQFTFISAGIAESVRKVYQEKHITQTELIKQYKQNQILKEKVNRELEETVRERTLQLEIAKNEIEKKAEDNMRMNQELDIANYRLKSYLNSFARKVVTNTHVDFESFKKAYPDELSCMRHLYELKASRGFSCKMCGNTKSFKGKGKFDARCTRCSYNESITANTIFHKTKFPLQKAFYMLYLISQTKTEVTASELAEMLELQKSTCQNFKVRIAEKMKENRKDSKGKPDWNQLILETRVSESVRGNSSEIKSGQIL